MTAGGLKMRSRFFMESFDCASARPAQGLKAVEKNRRHESLPESKKNRRLAGRRSGRVPVSPNSPKDFSQMQSMSMALKKPIR
jgi:hypothetical protein